MGMKTPAIVNIVNFIRACEPRLEMDLVLPVVRQLELGKRLGLPTTWLLQYDALIDERLCGLIRNEANPGDEAGIWFEVVQPLVEKAGLKWRGRYPWDWHAHVGFSVGYTPAERERLADVFMAEFKQRFGRYPATMGSWFFDAHLLGYLADRYGLQQACNCKEQWGTDGYSLWGGYYNQAYYPSRLNALMPAQTRANQIDVPVFRMLGSDPIYQYDCGRGGVSQGVVTLEPVYCGGSGGGGRPDWVRWFMDQMAGTPSLTFGYAQVGQENSFGWPRMAAGLESQYALVAKLRAEGAVRVETMSETGAWFKARWPQTPPSAFMALDDWKHEGRKSVWFETSRYRINLLWENGGLWIRDLHRFDETYAERYLRDVCPTPVCLYDTLPVVDGNLWATGPERAGLQFAAIDPAGQAVPFQGGEPEIRESSPAGLCVTWPLAGGGVLELRLSEQGLWARAEGRKWGLQLRGTDSRRTTLTAVRPDGLEFCHEGHGYAIGISKGRPADMRTAPGWFAQAVDGVLDVNAQGKGRS
jgi:hypothetical protein